MEELLLLLILLCVVGWVGREGQEERDAGSAPASKFYVHVLSQVWRLNTMNTGIPVNGGVQFIRVYHTTFCGTFVSMGNHADISISSLRLLGFMNRCHHV